jgi:hypothetical protein
MTESVTKTANKASKQPKRNPAAAALLPEVAAAEAPKLLRRRSSSTAKVKEEQPAAALPATRKSPTRTAPRVANIVVGQAPQEAKPAKVKKPKLVRDSFTMPASEYAAIATLKERCLKLGVVAKKSEILRAAISGLAKLNDADVAAAIQGLDAIKTGRPAKAAK